MPTTLDSDLQARADARVRQIATDLREACPSRLQFRVALQRCRNENRLRIVRPQRGFEAHVPWWQAIEAAYAKLERQRP